MNRSIPALAGAWKRSRSSVTIHPPPSQLHFWTLGGAATVPRALFSAFTRAPPRGRLPLPRFRGSRVSARHRPLRPPLARRRHSSTSAAPSSPPSRPAVSARSVDSERRTTHAGGQTRNAKPRARWGLAGLGSPRMSWCHRRAGGPPPRSSPPAKGASMALDSPRRAPRAASRGPARVASINGSRWLIGQKSSQSNGSSGN